MITKKKCPACNSELWLANIIIWGKAHKFDKQWKCLQKDCGLLLVEKAIED